MRHFNHDPASDSHMLSHDNLAGGAVAVPALSLGDLSSSLAMEMMLPVRSRLAVLPGLHEVEQALAGEIFHFLGARLHTHHFSIQITQDYKYLFLVAPSPQSNRTCSLCTWLS